MSGPIIGIDLGTTNSCVAIMEGQDPRVIVNAEGHRTTPSVVAFTEDSQVIVGEVAKRQAVSNSKNTVYGTKRLIGRRFNDSAVQQEAKTLPFELVQSKHGDCWVRARGKDYSPSQIGGFILSKMRETAEAYLGMVVKNAVVTIPAYFNDSQRQATKDAGLIAGLEVARIINEPTAAALAYGLNKTSLDKTIAVYDLGGGTFDISILDINDGVFEVRSTNGDTRLGGEDFDNAIIKYLIEVINKQLKTDVRQDLKALQRIKEAAEKAKIELSFAPETEINLPYLIGANSFTSKFTRTKLEELVGELIDRTISPCKKALADAGIGVTGLQEVLLVGGMTRMPKVQSVVKDFFRRDPSRGVNPDEAVAVGAAIQGGVLSGGVKNIVLLDLTPYSLGVKTLNNVFSPIIERNSSIPTRKSQVYTTSEDNQTYVHVSVFQGERSICDDNLHLGDFQLGPIPARPRGASRIEVSFELDSNGLLLVTAIDAESGVKAKATLKSNPRGHTKEELEKLAKEAEEQRAADLVKKAIIISRSACESTLYDTRKFLERSGDVLPQDERDKFKVRVDEFANQVVASPEKDEKFYTSKNNDLLVEFARVRELFDKCQQSQQSSESSEQPKTSE